eukprot:1143920-Pelagomonas_calceolata.AAC.1
MDHWQAGIICRSSWILLAGAAPSLGLSNCTSKRVLSDAVLSGAVCERGVAGLGQETSASPWLQNIKVVPGNFARCTASHPNLDALLKVAAWPLC